MLRCVLWDETRMRYSGRRATSVRLQPYRAKKSAARNRTRRYRKPKSPDTPSGPIRTQSFSRREKSAVAPPPFPRDDLRRWALTMFFVFYINPPNIVLEAPILINELIAL